MGLECDFLHPRTFKVSDFLPSWLPGQVRGRPAVVTTLPGCVSVAFPAVYGVRDGNIFYHIGDPYMTDAKTVPANLFFRIRFSLIYRRLEGQLRRHSGDFLM